ncbi:MAG TPA: polysaccharide biosynthesis tyrosine autokinase [Tepidisphaeraceae bacterium]
MQQIRPEVGTDSVQAVTRVDARPAAALRAWSGSAPAPAASSSSVPLLQVLWRRRWTLLGVMVGCGLLAGLYLLCATRVYSASATVLIRQQAPRAFAQGPTFLTPSETYLPTQVDVFRSTPVLARALDAANYRSMATFAGAGSDPVAWLRRGNALKVEAGRKSDVVVVTMESPWPDEAATFVNCVIDAYLADQSAHQRATGTEMVRVLQQEKDQLEQHRATCVASMLDARRNNGVLSFKEDKGNPSWERIESLSGSLTAAEIATIELRAQERCAREMLLSPLAISAFVTDQQAKGRDSGDYEYEELRRQLIQTALTLASSVPVVGFNHPRYQVLQAALDSLTRRIAQKERAMADAHVAALASLRGIAAEKEKRLHEALDAEQAHALALTPVAAEYLRLEGEVDRIQKKCELLDQRIAEISVDDVKSAPLNVQVLEPARVAERPVKPNRMLVMGAALMFGWLLGIGAALLGEWRDARWHSPQEIISVLGTAVVAVVPRISKRLSPVTRGQMVRLDVRSPVAEAYRSVRTSLYLGSARKARTILLASPMEGDGKSTTASNLAIAFAHAGERTLVVDCDLREPVQHLIFEADAGAGLTSVLSGEAKLREAIVPTDVPNLHLLPCGPVPTNPSELLTGKRFDRLMRTLAEGFDRVIVDSPPLMMFTDARVLAASADATLLVLRMNQSVRELGMLALDGLERAGANVLGAIANDVPPPRAYRKYGGTWQYAMAGAARRIADEDENSMVSERERRVGRSSELLTVKEPDWSSDAAP